MQSKASGQQLGVESTKQQASCKQTKKKKTNNNNSKNQQQQAKKPTTAAKGTWWPFLRFVFSRYTKIAWRPVEPGNQLVGVAVKLLLGYCSKHGQHNQLHG